MSDLVWAVSSRLRFRFRDRLRIRCRFRFRLSLRFRVRLRLKFRMRVRVIRATHSVGSLCPSRVDFDDIDMEDGTH